LCDGGCAKTTQYFIRVTKATSDFVKLQEAAFPVEEGKKEFLCDEGSFCHAIEASASHRHFFANENLLQ
jgi:hypothetical protein